MQERVRICDIAEELGLSTATVSNVIHGKTNKVSDETVRRVTALLEERQYIPSMAGILLARNSSGIIGVFVNDHPKYAGHTLRDGFIASALDALSTEIERGGQFMLVKKARCAGDVVRFASMWNMDGLVMTGFCEQDYTDLRRHIRIPIVVYDGLCRDPERLVNLTIDNYDGGYQMGRHLSGLGHRKLLCVSDNETGVDRERIEGFRRGAALFTAVCALFPGPVMRIYTKDAQTQQAAAEYLALISGTFLPMAGSTLLSTAFRCAEKPGLPLYAGIASAVLNTGLNDILIFGRLGLPAMGAAGAAIATVSAQCVNFLLLLLFAKQLTFLRAEKAPRAAARLHWSGYLSVLLPLLLCEASWSLGENVYAAIYGHMGTAESAAMTLTAPIQGLVIGALCGLSQAAGVIVGKKLGGEDYDGAYRAAKRLMVYGAVGAAVLSALVVLTSGAYVEIYRVERTVKLLTRQILFVYALAAPFKVLNMILGGGILRSGGRTAYVMGIDMLGTWLFGVPLGLLGAFVWKLPIAYVYLLLSLEECVRFAVSMAVFRRRRWMNRLGGCAGNL